MKNRTPSNELERMILEHIRRFGWHSTSVGTEMNAAFFAYTVGFYSSFGHPELLVFGLPPKTSHDIFVAAARAIQQGKPLDTNEPSRELFKGRACLPVGVPRNRYADFVCSARWYYNGNRFPLYQVVWPSDAGHYPWHPDADKSFTRKQPVLGQHAAGFSTSSV